MLGKLLDWIAAIKNDSLVEVDEGNSRFAACRRGETYIISEATRVFIEDSDVDRVGSQRALADRQVVTHAADREGCISIALSDPAYPAEILFIAHR